VVKKKRDKGVKISRLDPNYWGNTRKKSKSRTGHNSPVSWNMEKIRKPSIRKICEERVEKREDKKENTIGQLLPPKKCQNEKIQNSIP